MLYLFYHSKKYYTKKNRKKKIAKLRKCELVGEEELVVPRAGVK